MGNIYWVRGQSTYHPAGWHCIISMVSEIALTTYNTFDASTAPEAAAAPK